MKIIAGRWLEWLFGALEGWASRRKEAVSFCSCCGRNRYTGASCIGGGN